MKTDRNGYSLSIMQDDTTRCYLCGNRAGKLDRHEPCQGRNRRISKAYGMWVALCHRPCHLEIAHGDKAVADMLKQRAQIAAMNTYGWTKEEFIKRFGRNYCD